MPNKAFASPSNRLLFHKRNKVSHRASVPVLTKVRPGRWLYIEHIHPDQSMRTLRGRAAPGTGHAQISNAENRLHKHVSGIEQDAVTLTDVDHGEHHVSLTSSETSDATSSQSPPGIPSVKLQSDGIQSGSAGLSRDPIQTGVDEQGSQSLLLDQDCGPVLFFIHGVGGSSSLWHYQMRYFQEQGFEVVAPDLFGHGFSEAPRKETLYSFYELAEDSLAVFDKFCKKRNILIGHSYGSSFCTVIARERERRVAKMILISGGGPVALKPPLCHLFCLPTCLLACLKPLLTGAFIRQAFHKPGVTSGSGDFSAFNVPSHVLRGTMRGQYWPDGDQDYHADINVSVLLIYGLQDEFVSLEETEWMQETIFASSLETVSAGHMVMLECPEEVNRLIHQFISEDMAIGPRTSTRRAARTGSATPNTARRKTMPHLMPGGLT